MHLQSRFKIKFSCLACSQYVLKEYESDNIKFLLNVMNDQDYLQKISGIKYINDQIESKLNVKKANNEVLNDEDNFLDFEDLELI